MPLERTEFEVRVDRRRFQRSTAFIALLFLAYAALAVFASGGLRAIAVAGAVVFGVTGLWAGLAAARQVRREPVAATLDNRGVRFRRHELVGWEDIAEVRLGAVEPRLLFALRPLHYIAFLPAQASGLPRPRPGEWLAVKRHGTNMVLLAETVTPPAQDILAAVERLSGVPVRR